MVLSYVSTFSLVNRQGLHLGARSCRVYFRHLYHKQRPVAREEAPTSQLAIRISTSGLGTRKTHWKKKKKDAEKNAKETKKEQEKAFHGQQRPQLTDWDPTS